jgi:hypothetical protein
MDPPAYMDLGFTLIKDLSCNYACCLHGAQKGRAFNNDLLNFVGFNQLPQMQTG